MLTCKTSELMAGSQYPQTTRSLLKKGYYYSLYYYCTPLNNTLISSPEGWFLPFTVVVNGLATILATRSLQLGAVSANTLSYFYFSLFATYLVVLFLFWISSKMAVFDVSQKCDITIRIFKILEITNTSAFTIFPIV